MKMLLLQYKFKIEYPITYHRVFDSLDDIAKWLGDRYFVDRRHLALLDPSSDDVIVHDEFIFTPIRVLHGVSEHEAFTVLIPLKDNEKTDWVWLLDLTINEISDFIDGLLHDYERERISVGDVMAIMPEKLIVDAERRWKYSVEKVNLNKEST